MHPTFKAFSKQLAELEALMHSLEVIAADGADAAPTYLLDELAPLQLEVMCMFAVLAQISHHSSSSSAFLQCCLPC